MKSVSKHEALTMDTSSTVGPLTTPSSSQSKAVHWLRHSRALASDERSRSTSQSSGMAVVKRCSKRFPNLIGSSAPCAASAGPQTYLVTAGGPPEKNTLWQDRTRETTASGSSMMIQGNRPLDRCDDPVEHTSGQRCSCKTSKRSSKRTNLIPNLVFIETMVSVLRRFIIFGFLTGNPLSKIQCLSTLVESHQNFF